MKRYFFIAISFLCTSNLSFSQDTYQLREAMDFFRTNKLQTDEWKRTLTESDIKGSPYLKDEFVVGTIFTTSKLQYTEVPLRYNIFNDELEFKTSDNKILAMASPEIIERVEFGEFKMVYVPYSNAKKIHRGFFRILEEGNASFYSRSEIMFKEAIEPAAYKDAEPAKFMNKPDSYYIRIGLEEAKKVDNKKELIEVFPNHQREIADFIKKYKIKTTQPESLKKLVQYYNTF